MTAILFLLSPLVLVLSAILVLRTRSLGIFLILLILYAYSIHIFLVTAIYIWIGDQTPYWFNYPYYVDLNQDFYNAISLYLLFAILYIVLLLSLLPRGGRASASPPRAALCRPVPLLLINFVLIGINIWLWRDALSGAILDARSAYMTYKRDEPELGSLYPLSRLMFDLSGKIAWTLLFALFVRNPRFSIPWMGTYLRLGIVVQFILVSATLFLLGDKLSLASGLLFCATLTIPGATNTLPIFGLSMLGLLSINLITFFRHFDLSTVTADVLVMTVQDSFFSLLQHGETHSGLSLYLILREKVPLAYGLSLEYAFASLIPSFVGIERPADPYEYFAYHVHILDEVGWGIHYASDWMMNFGIPGLCVGAIILGLLHAFVYRRVILSPHASLEWYLVFCVIVSNFPIFIRSPLGIKGLVYDIAAVLLIRGFFIAPRVRRAPEPQQLDASKSVPPIRNIVKVS